MIEKLKGQMEEFNSKTRTKKPDNTKRLYVNKSGIRFTTGAVEEMGAVLGDYLFLGSEETNKEFTGILVLINYRPDADSSTTVRPMGNKLRAKFNYTPPKMLSKELEGYKVFEFVGDVKEPHDSQSVFKFVPVTEATTEELAFVAEYEGNEPREKEENNQTPDPETPSEETPIQ